MNRIYETDISVSVRVRNVPEGVRLTGGGRIVASARIKGKGAKLFGYMFDDNVGVSADYSAFSRNGNRLVLSCNEIRDKVASRLPSSVSLLHFMSDSIIAEIEPGVVLPPEQDGAKIIPVDVKW